MEILFLIGRVVVGGYFLYNAYNHFSRTKMLAGYAGSKGVPSPTIAVLGSGLLIAVGGALVVLGYQTWLGALLIIVFLVPVSFAMHGFWADKDPQMKMANMVNFSKNLALAGAMAMVFAFDVATDWHPLSLGAG